MVRTKELCRLVRCTSEYVAAWITRQPQVKEESITDWSLDWLSLQAQEFAYRSFNRLEEAKITGADWEWWIVGPHRAVRARVQAKRLAAGDNYAALAYCNAHGLQIVKLLTDAKSCGAVAIYMLYATSIWKRGRWRLMNGMSLADAAAIDSQFVSPGRRSISDSDVLAQSIAFPAIFCHPLTMPPGMFGVNTIARLILAETAAERGDMGLFTELDGVPGVYDHPPSEVETFLEVQRSSSNALPNEWFVDSFQDVDALFVIDLRQRGDRR